jgi:hypothetical protein
MQNITEKSTKPDLSDGSVTFSLKNLGILRQNMKKTLTRNKIVMDKRKEF